MNRNNQLLRLVQTSVLIALVIVMTFVPYIGYISWGGISITLVHVPVILGAVVLGPAAGTILGAAWGLSNMIKAILMPPSPLDGILFSNPLVSVLPRVLVGLAAGWLFVWLSKIRILTGQARTKGAMPTAQLKKTGYGNRLLQTRALPAAITSLVATLIHSVLVLGMLFVLFGGSSHAQDLGISAFTLGSLLPFVLAMMGANGLFEILVAVVLIPPLSMVLKRTNRR